MKTGKWIFLFLAGLALERLGVFAPWHELGHIIKSVERGGAVTGLEWARVFLTYVDVDVLLFGYWWEFFTTFIMMIVAGAVGWQYKWPWPAWGFFFGMLHGAYWSGRGSWDFFTAANMSGRALEDIQRSWDILSAGFLGFTWAGILIVVGLGGIKKAAEAAHERGFSR